jgi:NAD-dependent deacetylase
VLTGAGISAGSGLPTFRGPDGLWERSDGPGPSGLDASRLAEDPAYVWTFCGKLREAVKRASPNRAHVALADAQRRLPDDATLTIITQNVDGLHQRAGSTDVIEFHGSLSRIRCANAGCSKAPYEDPEPPPAAPLCERCGGSLRSDIVLFDEAIPAVAEWHAKRALRECDLYVAIGTSGTVSPASNFVRAAEFARARTVIVNLTPMQPRHPGYDEEILGRAEDLVPELFAV